MDEMTVRRWWTRWPQANIGGLTGASSGFIVLDIDPRHGGDERLRDFERQYGTLPDTVESLTGGGGRHVFFKHPGVPIRNDAGTKLGPGLDVRGDGGYIVLPPSLHVSGQRYEWEASSHPDDVSLAPMPPWLMARLTAAEGSRNGQPPAGGNPVPEGRRNTTLASLAGTMRRRGVTTREIGAALTVVNADRCTPPLSKEEVRRIAVSIGRYDPVIPETAPTLQPVTATRLLAMAFPEPRWAIPELVIEGLPLLAGRPKEGKSLMALGFCLAVAVGGRALGHIPVARGEALYIGLEDSYRRLKARMEDKLLEAKERDPAAPDRLHFLTEFPRLDDGGVETLDAWLAEHPGCRLVVIDVLERVAPRRSGRHANQYAHDYAMVADLQRLALRRRVAILAVHHTTKARYENVIDEVSGTTGLTAAADTIIVLTQAQGSAVLHVRGRDVAREDLAVRFDPALGTWTLVGEAKEPVISPECQAVLAVLRQAARPMRPREIRCALGRQDKKSMGALYVLLHAMREAGDIDSPGRGLYTTKITKNTKNAQVTKNAKDPLPVEEVLQAAECILSNCHETA